MSQDDKVEKLIRQIVSNIDTDNYWLAKYFAKLLSQLSASEYTVNSTKDLISMSITRNEMGEILLLCTKNIHFSFRDAVYLQADGNTMGSPLGSVLAGIFIVDLKKVFCSLIYSRA